MKPLPGILTFTLALAIAGPAQALHCNGNITTIETPAGTFYIDDRSNAAGDIDHWGYLEGNGLQGLQSGGESFLEICHGYPYCFTDPCMHANPDHLIF